MKKQLQTNPCEDCGKCCLDTEMILSENDIDLIIKHFKSKLKKEDIVRLNKDGYSQFQNISGHCIFLDIDTKLCKIYEVRPEGCKFYPFIYDLEMNKCKYDNDCPRVNFFYLEKKEENKLCYKLKRFMMEEIGI